MTFFDLGWLTFLVVAGVLYLGDGLNSITAALREILAVLRKDKP